MKLDEAQIRDIIRQVLEQSAQQMPDAVTLERLVQQVGQSIRNIPPSPPPPTQPLDAQTLAGYIDHTLLKPETTADQIEQLCREALDYGFASVCINPSYVKLAAELLIGSPVKVCTVVGFPLGATATTVKAFETQQAIYDGANEIDMVLNVGALKNGQDMLVEQDIHAVAQTAHTSGALCKVILETALLTDAEKVRACRLARNAGADFVKTSTGFSGGGATVEDITLMRQTVGPTMGVKASGGIRTFADARAMIAAGATRIGASAGVKIVQGAKG